MTPHYHQLQDKRDAGQVNRQADATVDVALFLPSLEGGGAEQVFVTLAALFAQRGLAVDLVLARRAGPLLARVPPEVRLIDLSASRPSRGIPALIRYLRRAQPRALLSALTHANIAAAIAYRLARARGRCVLSERADLSRTLEIDKKPFDRWLTRMLARRVYPWADAVIAVSTGVGQSVQRIFDLDEQRLHVVYNPINIERVRQAAQAEASFPWDDLQPIFVAAGRLTAQKNFPLLLRAFARVRAQTPCHLAILGEGEERRGLESLIVELGLAQDVWLAGFCDNPYALMARASALVSSSDYEGLSNVLIDALALGISVVATHCPSGQAEILLGGRYGILTPPGDGKALAAAMVRVLAGNFPRFDHQEAIERFRPDRIADQYLKVLGVMP